MSGKRYWLAVGTQENWITALEQGNIWGLRPGRLQEVFWELLDEGDVLLFYNMRPVSGVVGFGTVKTKFKKEAKLLFPDELKAGKVLYPLCLEFDVDYCLPPDHWQTKKVTSPPLKPLVRGGFQPLNAQVALPVIEELAPGWLARRAAVAEAVEVLPSIAEAPPAALSHDALKDILVKIGEIQKFIAEAEYSMDGQRLDVVWRRVAGSVPTYVFEVHVGGDIQHALGKLKHAYDLWNSHIFLVASGSESAKVNQFLSGMFHEIRARLRFLPIDKVEELYRRKRAFKDLESELEIPA